MERRRPPGRVCRAAISSSPGSGHESLSLVSGRGRGRFARALAGIAVAGAGGPRRVLRLRLTALGRRSRGGGDCVEAAERLARIHLREVEDRDAAMAGEADRHAGAADVLAVSRPAEHGMRRPAQVGSEEDGDVAGVKVADPGRAALPRGMVGAPPAAASPRSRPARARGMRSRPSRCSPARVCRPRVDGTVRRRRRRRRRPARRPCGAASRARREPRRGPSCGRGRVRASRARRRRHRRAPARRAPRSSGRCPPPASPAPRMRPARGRRRGRAKDDNGRGALWN